MGELTDRVKTIYITRKKQLISKFWPVKFAPKTKFIILSKPRTGSTLLHTLLNSHPNIYSYGETLRRVGVNKTGFTLNNEVFKDHPKSIMAVGLKIFYHYFEDNNFNQFFDEVRRNQHIKIIHLLRNNDLDTFISLKNAEKTNQWSIEKDLPYSQIRSLNPDINEFKEYLKYSNNLQQSITQAFEKHQTLDISYEMLVKNQKICLNEIQDFLGVPQKKLFTLLKKQSPEDYNYVSNYAELLEIYKSQKR